jgi:hypothetical protein
MLTVTFLAVALLTVVIIGGLVLMRLATTREDHDGHLPRRATTRIAAAARAITGLYVEVAEPGVRADGDRILACAAPRRQAPGWPGDDARHVGCGR